MQKVKVFILLHFPFLFFLVFLQMKNVKIIILVYDVTNMESFQNIAEWYKKLENANSGKELHG